MPLYATLPGKGETQAGMRLVDALKAISLFASTDQTIPMINAVKLEADPKAKTLTVVATNRYILGTYTLPWDGDELNVLLPLASVKLLILNLTAALKPHRRYDKVPIGLVVEEGRESRLKVSVYGAEVVAVDNIDPDYPKWASLMPDPAEPHLSTGEIRFNPTYLATFAKVGERNEPVIFTFHGATKPALVTFPDTPFKGIIMPMKGNQ